MSKSNHEHITKPIASWAARAQYTIPMIITSNRQLTNPYPSAAARIIAQKEKKKEAAGPRIKTLSHHLNLHMDSNTRDEPFLPTNQPIAPNQQHRSINQHPQQSPPPHPQPARSPKSPRSSKTNKETPIPSEIHTQGGRETHRLPRNRRKRGAVENPRSLLGWGGGGLLGFLPQATPAATTRRMKEEARRLLLVWNLELLEGSPPSSGVRWYL